MATETLQCKHGHSFTRERTRGKKPQFCPTHAPEKVTYESDVETLSCEHDGHSFTRKRGRGRKPRFCDEHKPSPETKTHVSGEHKQDPRAAELLQNETLNPEMRKKLEYVEKHISSGLRTDSDVTFLIGVQKDLVRQASIVTA